MFDPEFETIVNELAASKDIINNEVAHIDYKNLHLRKFVDTLRYFYNEDLSDELLDVLYHDAYKLVFNSDTDIKPALEKDGYVDAYVTRDTVNEDVIYGQMTKRIATAGNERAYNLIYNKGEVTRKYNFYDDSVIMTVNTKDGRYTKVAHVNSEGNLEYAVFLDTDDSKYFILRTDWLNLKDVLSAYMEMEKSEEIKAVFPELYERSPYKYPSRTRK